MKPIEIFWWKKILNWHAIDSMTNEAAVFQLWTLFGVIMHAFKKVPNLWHPFLLTISTRHILTSILSTVEKSLLSSTVKTFQWSAVAGEKDRLLYETGL